MNASLVKTHTLPTLSFLHMGTPSGPHGEQLGTLPSGSTLQLEHGGHHLSQRGGSCLHLSAPCSTRAGILPYVAEASGKLSMCGRLRKFRVAP